MARPRKTNTRVEKLNSAKKEVNVDSVDSVKEKKSTILNQRRNVTAEKTQQSVPDTMETEGSAKSEGDVTETVTSDSDVASKNSANKRGRKRRLNTEIVHKPKKIKALLEVPKLPTRRGLVLTVGQGDIGQLGLGEDVLEKSRPGIVASIPDLVVSVAAGGMHSVCLTVKGEVYTFGCNDEGALGRVTDGKEAAEFEPGKIEISEKVVQVSAGDSHSAALTETGKVFVWGNFRDSSGSIGLTPFGPQKKPIQILPKVTIVKVASGSDHLALLANDGKLYTCGCGEQGQLGRIPQYFSARGGRKGLSYMLNPAPVKVSKRQGCGYVGFDNVWTGSYVTFCREKDSGDIYGFGLNNFYQLGFDDSEPRFFLELIQSFWGRKWQCISSGQHHTIALDDTGSVYTLGRKEYGRLGLGEDCEDQSSPTLVPGLKEVVCSSVAAGNLVSYAVSENGDVYSWGMGTNGQLGHGDEDDVFSPKKITGKAISSKKCFIVSSGGQHTIMVADDSDCVPDSDKK